MSTQPARTWPEPRKAQLATLWAEDKLSAAQIGCQLDPPATPGAVCSAARRFGLPYRGARGPRRSSHPRAHYGGLFLALQAAQGPRRTPRPGSPRGPLDEAPGRAALLDLGPGMCRWPVGELYCGSPIERGPYCAGHWARAHR